MSILVYAEHLDGTCKKAAFEAVTYARKVADEMSLPCIALTIGDVGNAGELGTYGADRVLHAAANNHFDGQHHAKQIAHAATEVNAKVIILSHTSTGKALAGRLAVMLDAGLASGVNSLPDLSTGFRVKRSVYSGKAVATYELSSDIKVLSVMGNTFPAQANGTLAQVEQVESVQHESRITVQSVNKADGSVPLPEADLVVSGGRGFKGPENWDILLQLAEALGAATACSRPVADSGWRPHHEHVGQTGVAIRPNLYIAIGISGAIQHLGGVNNSKTIVVINKDPEAPFFKAADYGVVGDLFEVVPKLTAAVKAYKEGV